MALEGPPRSIRFALRIDVQHDLRDLAPVSTFGIRVEQAHIGHSVLSIIRGERGFGRREIGNIRIEGRHGVLGVGEWRRLGVV